MPKFRKKPVVVEANQFLSGPVIEQEVLADWCRGKLCGVRLPPKEREIEVHTLEGDMRARVGDWIIKGVNGEFYPCKPDIFDKTYEPV